MARSVISDPGQLNAQSPVIRDRGLGTVSSPAGNTLASRALCYGLLAIYAASVYVIVVALGGFHGEQFSPPWQLNLIALLLIAATFVPVHSWLRARIDLLLYGWHDDPYAVLSEVRQHLDHEQAQAPGTIVPTIAATIASTLRLPYVAIQTGAGDGAQAITHGTPPPLAEVLTVPLVYRGAAIGALRAAGRRPGEALSVSDRRLLHDLAQQVGITLHAARLFDALQASREQLVTAREEERRRIRRDLHDGLGPTLASLRIQLGAVRRMVRDQPDSAEALIDELRDDVRAATAEIRRLVYGLRPPLLDEHGLLGALRSLSSGLDGTIMTLEVPETLPPLAAALEVATYRIASEAVHNVARHAGATRCTVRLKFAAEALVLEVSDNGRGLPDGIRDGVGLMSMRERAAELGGTLTIASCPEGGTQVAATIPCR